MKILNFNSNNEDMPDIKPAKSHMPDWYKDIKGINKNKLVFEDGMHAPVLNVKSCMPFLDSFTTGYIIELAQDVYVEIKDNEPMIHYKTDPVPVSLRKNGENIIPIPDGYANIHFVWKYPHVLNAGPGYSAIITHPFNRYDLPFISLTGVVDIDVLVGDGSIPFFVKEGFEGLIPAGTPILQVIPFKRESWKINKDKELFEKNRIENILKHRTMLGWYKTRRWQKKEFN